MCFTMHRIARLFVTCACVTLVACSHPPASHDDHASASRAASTTAPRTPPSLGRDVSVTIYPISLAGRSVPPVSEVLGMMLERGGMDDVALSATSVATPTVTSLDESAAAFVTRVKADPPATAYALYCEFLGTPGRGVDEVRTLLVTQQGEVVWADAQRATDADFRAIAPREPMECCMLVVQRLTPVFDLLDPERRDASEGRITKRWKQETSLPHAEEERAIAARTATLRSSLGSSPGSVSIGVFAPHARGTATTRSADLIARLSEAGFAGLVSMDATPDVSIRSGMNQQMVLWSFARSFGAWVAAHPPATTYVIHADYLLGSTGAGETTVAGVHTVICDAKGELVLVDFQNGHHADFKAIQPRTSADCDRLVARRLAALLR